MLYPGKIIMVARETENCTALDDVDETNLTGVKTDVSEEKKAFLELIEVGMNIGCDVDGDIINGEYHHILDEARRFGMTIDDVLNHYYKTKKEEI